MSAKVTINEEKNGIELRFDVKPSPEMLFKLNKSSFRWSRLQNIWWARASKKRMAFVQSEKIVSRET